MTSNSPASNRASQQYYDPDELKLLRRENKRLMTIILQKQTEINRLTADLISKQEECQTLQQKLDIKDIQMQTTEQVLQEQNQQEVPFEFNSDGDIIKYPSQYKAVVDKFQSEKQRLSQWINILEKRLEAADRVIDSQRRPIIVNSGDQGDAIRTLQVNQSKNFPNSAYVQQSPGRAKHQSLTVPSPTHQPIQSSQSPARRSPNPQDSPRMDTTSNLDSSMIESRIEQSLEKKLLGKIDELVNKQKQEQEQSKQLDSRQQLPKQQPEKRIQRKIIVRKPRVQTETNEESITSTTEETGLGDEGIGSSFYPKQNRSSSHQHAPQPKIDMDKLQSKVNRLESALQKSKEEVQNYHTLMKENRTLRNELDIKDDILNNVRSKLDSRQGLSTPQQRQRMSKTPFGRAGRNALDLFNDSNQVNNSRQSNLQEVNKRIDRVMLSNYKNGNNSGDRSIDVTTIPMRNQQLQSSTAVTTPSNVNQSLANSNYSFGIGGQAYKRKNNF